MLFLPPDVVEREYLHRHFEKIVRENNLEVLGWRNVPVNSEILGEKSRQSQPNIMQVFLSTNSKIIERLAIDENAFERKLYIIRREAENRIRYGSLRGMDWAGFMERAQHYLPSPTFVLNMESMGVRATRILQRQQEIDLINWFRTSLTHGLAEKAVATDQMLSPVAASSSRWLS